jgi:hypothetical protein
MPWISTSDDKKLDDRLTKVSILCKNGRQNMDSY